jgi:hypothetical protein
VRRVILYNRHIEKVLDLSLHCFRDDIAPVCPILHPQCPVHCRCAFHPHCALHCRHIAVMPSTPLRCHRAFDRRCPCAVHCPCCCCIVIAPSIAVAVAIAVAPSITVVAVVSPWCHPSPLLLSCCRCVFHCRHRCAIHHRRRHVIF